MAIRLVDYQVQGTLAGLTLGEAKTVIETIDRGLWKRNHSVLRDDVASLRHDLRQSSALTDDLHQRVTETIERFNALDPSSLNTELLDDASLPKGGAPKPPKLALKPTDPAPKPKPPATTEVTPLEERVTKLEQRVDGHDRRHEEAEANLKGLNGAVGIAKNGEGAWLPVPDGQFDRNAKVQQYLGYARDNEGQVTFADRNSGSDKLVIWPAVVALVIALVIFMIIMATGFGPVWASIWALPAVVIAIIVFLITNRTTAPAQ